MKKRYLVAAAAALIGGSLAIEMQAGSTGLETGTVAGAGGGIAAMTARAEGGGGGGIAGATVHAAKKRAAAMQAKAAETARDAVIVSDEDVGVLPSGGGMAGVLASDFDGLLVQTSGYDGAPLRLPVADAAGMIDTSGFGGGGQTLLGRNSVGGGSGQPQAVSAVPEPATWISLLVGMALVGYSLRQRTGPRSGPRSVSS